MMYSKRHPSDVEQWSQSSGSNVIPRRARPGLAGLRPHTKRATPLPAPRDLCGEQMKIFASPHSRDPVYRTDTYPAPKRASPLPAPRGAAKEVKIFASPHSRGPAYVFGDPNDFARC